MAVLGIDCRFASALVGLGSFTRGMVTSLVTNHSDRSYVLFVKDTNEPWLDALKSRANVRLVVASFPHYSFAEQWKLPTLIRTSQCDLFFAPHFNVPFFCPVPFVCTVHDLILHAYPNQASLLKRMAYFVLLSRSLACAAAIVAVSNGTADAIKQNYPAAAGRIYVLYPGIGSEFKKSSDDAIAAFKKRHDLSRPFFVYVGNTKAHKNVQTLIDAFHAAALPTHELVLVTKKSAAVSLVLGENVRIIDSVDPTDLPMLYSAADGFATATLMEGFCLPLIEAMACECPVLATIVPPLPEVCGDHALLVAPTKSSLAEGFKKLAMDSGLRSSKSLLSAKIWTGRYTWTSASHHLSRLLTSVSC